MAEQTFAVIDTGRRRKYSIRKHCSPTGLVSNGQSEHAVEKYPNTFQIYTQTFTRDLWRKDFSIPLRYVRVQMN